MERSVNPLLPLNEFIPDVEARVFEGSDGQKRLFLYGSHDEYDRGTWCSYQYRVYSAPVSDLSEWTDHGVSLASKKGEGYLWEGEDRDGVLWKDALLYAPDVILHEGKYWLASCFSGGGLGMSVSDCPEGPFSPAEQIVYEDGEPLGSIDPALFSECGKLYLIWGQRKEFGGEGLTGVELTKNSEGVYAVARRETKRYLFGDEKGTDQGFGFYEGPSIRKIGEMYYVIYPSDKGQGIHMMSYATAKHPLGPYTFQGNILDNDGCDLAMGNNHGSLCEVNGQWYIFYHRGFGNSNMRRKVCVESITIGEDGKIQKTEMTNHGFGGPLCPYERIEAAYATHVRLDGFVAGCYLEEQGKNLHPLVHITNGNCVEYKDFDFGRNREKLFLQLEILPLHGGKIEIAADVPDGKPIVVISVPYKKKSIWNKITVEIPEKEIERLIGVHTLYFRFKGEADKKICELAAFQFIESKERKEDPADALASAWLTDNGDGTFTNGISWTDYPDTDVIRVGDTYYLTATSMHLFPGGLILSSKDLVHWHHEGYALPYNKLLPLANQGQEMELNHGEIYDKGAWAGSLRYNRRLQKFYFLVNMQDGDTEEYAVLSVADHAAGPWELYRLSQRLYDPGLFFEEDGTAYVVHGQGQLYLSRLKLVDEKTGEYEIDTEFTPKNNEGYYDRPFFNYEDGYFNEGSHVYKINGIYYVLTTPTWKGTDTKKEICIQTKDLVYGPYDVKDIHASFMNFGENGVHQGGIVDVPLENGETEWWSIIFQDRHKLGRTPTLQPVFWEEDSSGLLWPMIGKADKQGLQAVTTFTKPQTACLKTKWMEDYREIESGTEEIGQKIHYFDGFDSKELSPVWQWNHIPDDNKWSLTKRRGYLRLYSATKTTDFSRARNTLRQRIIGPESEAVIKMDITHMGDGDIAGLAVFQKDYNYIGIKRNGTEKLLIINDCGSERIQKRLKGDITDVWLKAKTVRMEYRTEFFYSVDGICFFRLGGRYDMHYGDYVGMGFGIFQFSTINCGGYVDIDFFELNSNVRNSNYMRAGDVIEAEQYDDQSFVIEERNIPAYKNNIRTTWTSDRHETKLLTKWGDAFELTVSGFCEGDWLQYNKINFTEKYDWINIRAASVEEGKFEVRAGSVNGKIIATVCIPKTGSQENFRNIFAKVDAKVSGVQKLFLIYHGSDNSCRINWFQFGCGQYPQIAEIPEIEVRYEKPYGIEVQWEQADCAFAYDLRFDDGEKKHIVTNVTSPFCETEIQHGERYQICIRSKCQAGVSEWSRPICIDV